MPNTINHKGFTGSVEPETELITIPVSPYEKEVIEAFCRSLGMTVDDVLAVYMKNIVRSRDELLDRFHNGESAEKLITEVADRTIRELEVKVT